MKTKGKFFWKKGWFSFCSRHLEHDPDCHLCQIGSWQNLWVWRLSNFVYNLFPQLWRWWVNQ